MRDLVYYVAVSLDGRICAPDGAFDAFPIEGDHMDAINAEWADTVPGAIYDALGMTAPRGRISTVLMGWETFAAGLPHIDDPYPHLEQIVFSRTRGPEEVGAGVRITNEDPREVVAALKAQDAGDIWLCGGGVLADALRDDIDRLVLKVNPVVFGDGRPLFAGAYAPEAFVLDRSRAFGSGVVMNEYRRRAASRRR